MNNLTIANILRFAGLVLVQGLVFRNIGEVWSGFPYLEIIVFPIFILLLPLRAPKALVVLLGFAAGMLVDVLYDTLGVHAAAATFTAFARPLVLNFMEPRGGYNVSFSPSAARMGLGWFLRYAAVLMLAHLFFYFSVEAFTFVYIGSILLKTAVSFAASMLFIVIYQVIFNPTD